MRDVHPEIVRARHVIELTGVGCLAIHVHAQLPRRFDRDPGQLRVVHARLTEMLAVRRQLSAEKVAAENASRLLEDAMLQRLSRRRIAGLTADIDLLDQRLVEIVMADPALAQRFRLLTSMPG